MNRKKLLFLPVIILIISGALFFIFNTNNDVKLQKTLFTKASLGTPDDPNGRIEYERRMLIDPATGKIPEDIRVKELEFSKTLPNVEDVSLRKTKGMNTLTWSKRGPVNLGGRTRALAIDVRTNDLTHLNANSMVVIAGGASGGIYKAINGGGGSPTWVNKLPADSIHSITCIAQDTRSGQEDIWYAGTGENGQNLAGGLGFEAFFKGDGIYKSVDNGETWTLLSSTSINTPQSFSSTFNFIYNIAVSKTTSTVFAAARNSIQKSSNGGTTWGLVRGDTNDLNSYPDVQITSTGVIYTTIPSGLTDAGISRSSDDGDTWTNITPSTFPSTFGRNVIGIAPSNENIVYFWVSTPGQGSTQSQIWKYVYPGSGSGVGDGNWTNLTANLPAPSGQVAGLGTQFPYDMVIKVKTDDPNFVVIGGTNLYRTTDGFSTPISATGNTNWFGGYAVVNDVSQYENHHPDQHSFVFGGSTIVNTVFSGSDGGVSFSPDVTATPVVWSDYNTGYVTSQFYSIAIDPATANDNHIIGGLQDNGNYFTGSSSFNQAWTELPLGGDGGFTAISSGHTNYYIEVQNGNVWRFQLNPTTGNYVGLPFAKLKPAYQTSYLFVCPFILDPNDNKIMYMAAGDSVWRNSNTLGVPDFNQSSTYTNWDSLTHSSTGGAVTALAVSKSPANILYVGGNNGKILKITGANTGDPTATDISTGKGMPAGYVNYIGADPSDANNLIVVFSNYNVQSIWSSSDGGGSWTDVSGNLEQNPDGSGNGPSVRWIAAVKVGGQTTYYAATSTGLYSTSNFNGQSTVWAQEGATTIGNVVCPMVKGRDADGYVVVATHGMGVYSATQTVTAVENELGVPKNYTLSQNYPNPFNPSTNINFSLPQTGKVVITLFDALGRKVRDIVNKEFSAGNHSLNFNAVNLTSGVYFYRLQSDKYVQTKKMILLR